MLLEKKGEGSCIAMYLFQVLLPPDLKKKRKKKNYHYNKLNESSPSLTQKQPYFVESNISVQSEYSQEVLFDIHVWQPICYQLNRNNRY